MCGDVDIVTLSSSCYPWDPGSPPSFLPRKIPNKTTDIPECDISPNNLFPPEVIIVDTSWCLCPAAGENVLRLWLAAEAATRRRAGAQRARSRLRSLSQPLPSKS